MSYQIEKGVPIPAMKRATNGESKYPFAQMDVGDSFFVHGKSIHTLNSQAHKYGTRLSRKFTARAIDGGTRVWRIA